ncbi:glycosyl transferase, group 1 [Caldicellulosiruptor saccharolyticus DSM 8903]|uniref:Glycosyl transferase, group 1 n=1 Tax=Caldicellulosiruptor saccharolyticus (strain ATCC 43494 / DSM 8903 / Tp8T 6331) TaxID=351627 RepID=A4XG07_CALS8|nr:glycosyltransferase [Caldicellulosiruptor saccharolyticus]ABP65842.1 glycosyl transferase, group 1 [Caldicellulosiruptor saccharolyticus DSM 8903]
MNLILLTIGYPHPKRDVFVGNEIDFLCKAFDTIYILPVQAGKILPKKLKNGDKYKLHEKVKVWDVEHTIKDVLFISPRLIGLAIKEAFKAVFQKSTIRYKILYLWMIFRWIFLTSITLKNLSKLFEEEGIDPNDTVLYSYWFHFLALSIALFKKPVLLKISKAHGSDLYSELFPQPCKEFIINHIDKVFACSKMGAEYINKRYNTDKAVVSYLGTFNDYEINLNKKRSRPFKIVSCARVVPVKRVEKIVDSLEKIEGYKILWTHIGDGELFESLKEYAQRKLSKKENITYNFMGFLPNSKILDLYAKEDFNLFVNTSSSEGLPVSIMEAMSFGIPVVATDVGGVREIVKDGSNGYLLEKDFTEDELSSLIEKFIQMPEGEYQRFCTEARKTWEERFNAKKTYEEFVSEIVRLAQSKKGAELKNGE